MNANTPRNASTAAEDIAHADVEDVVATLPAEAIEPLGMSLGTQLTSDSNVSYGAYINTMYVGRDDPFPCYKKSRWSDQSVIKIVQQY